MDINFKKTDEILCELTIEKHTDSQGIASSLPSTVGGYS